MDYFDELRDELTFHHLFAQYGLKGFFDFSEAEISYDSPRRSRLIPEWYCPPN